jgi:hypothetical protein
MFNYSFYPMKNCIALMFFVLFLNEVLAQEKFFPGYIRSLEGETITGLIDYRNWNNNPKMVNFKLTEQDDAQVFHALEIAEFGVKDEIYVGAVVDKELSVNLAYNLNKSPELELGKDTLFLQTLVKGDKTLLGMKASGKQNFYIKEGRDYTLLQYKWYIREQEGRKFKAENLKYKRQLVDYLGTCDRMNNLINDASYTSKSLESIFLQYYQCKDEEPEFRKAREKSVTQWGVLAGASSTSIWFNNELSIQDISSYNFPGTNSIVAGVYLEIILPRNDQKWSFYNELLYSSYELKGSFEDIINENEYRNVEGRLGYGYLKVNNMLRFRYRIGNYRLFVNGGMSNGFALYETNKSTVYKKFYSSETIEEGKVLGETRMYEQGFIVGAGAIRGRLSAEFRFERGNGMSNYTSLGSRVERFFLLLSYRLN